MRFKICIANLIYRMCDKEKLSLIGFENFIKIVNKYNFSGEHFDTLEENNINENNFTIKNIVNIIDNNLNKLYVLLKNEAEN